MGYPDECKALLNELGIDSTDQSLGVNFSMVHDALREYKQTVTSASELKLKHVKIMEENFIKYQNERNAQLIKEEQECLQETEELSRITEVLKREGDALQARLKEETAELNKCRALAKEAKKKLEAVMQEDEKASEQFLRTKKCLSIAIGWYQLYLGLQITLGRDRLVVAFGTFNDTFQPSKHKLTFLRTEDGYLVEGGSHILSLQEVMAALVRAREAFINPPQSITQRDSDRSTTVSL